MINVEEKTNSNVFTENGVSCSTRFRCLGYSDTTKTTTDTPFLIPDSKTINRNGYVYVKRAEKPRFYRFKSRLKGRTLKIVISSDTYIEEIQKVILELRVRGR